MAKIFGSVLFKNALGHVVRQPALNRSIHLSAVDMGIKIGDHIPSVEVYEGNPGNAVNFKHFCRGKKIVLFGVPGAFTPGCSKTHLPGFIDRAVEIKSKGVDEIICLSVNDVFVMDAWGKDQNATGKVRMFADPNGDFTKSIGLGMDIAKLGGLRSKRYSMIIDRGVVKFLNVEPDGTGLTCSLAQKLPL